MNKRYNQDNIKEFVVNASESINIEIKKSENALPNDFWSTYSSFSNTRGGIVILGVKEIRNKEQKNQNIITGISDIYKVKQDLFNCVKNPTKTNYSNINDNHVDIFEIEGKKILIVQILPAPAEKKPVYLDGDIFNTFIRVGDADTKATPDQVKAMLRDSRDNQDAELLENYSINDLDIHTIEKYKSKLASRKPTCGYEHLSNIDFLIQLGVFRRDRSVSESIEHKLTVGGLLFFGKTQSILDKFPHYHLDYINRTGQLSNRWADRVSTSDLLGIEMNLHNFYEIVLVKLITSSMIEFQLNSNLERVDTNLDEALREAFVNTIMHADYFSSGSSILIEVNDGWYTFRNPGNLRISIEEYISGGHSNPRNAIITSLFRHMGASERTGSGGPSIFRIAKENRFRIPDITSTTDQTVLKIWSVDLATSYPDLNENEKSILSYLIKSTTPKLKKEILSAINIKESQFRSATKNLIDKKIIETVGASVATKYLVSYTSGELITNIYHSLDIYKNSSAGN